MNDEALIGRCLSGDTEAFEGLVVAYQRPVYSLALRVTGNADDAMDVAQEAFLKAFRSLPTFRRGSPFRPWLLAVTANTATDFLRHKRPVAAGEALAADIPDVSPGPAELAEEGERNRRVREAIMGLAPGYRILVELFHIQGLSLAEVSAVTGLNVTVVKNRLFRARKMLRERLAGVLANHTEGGG
ncbi:MAG: RNA polymerase sigma factor [Ignavibacteriales bacterium]